MKIRGHWYNRRPLRNPLQTECTYQSHQRQRLRLLRQFAVDIEQWELDDSCGVLSKDCKGKVLVLAPDLDALLHRTSFTVDQSLLFMSDWFREKCQDTFSYETASRRQDNRPRTLVVMTFCLAKRDVRAWKIDTP